MPQCAMHHTSSHRQQLCGTNPKDSAPVSVRQMHTFSLGTSIWCYTADTAALLSQAGAKRGAPKPCCLKTSSLSSPQKKLTLSTTFRHPDLAVLSAHTFILCAMRNNSKSCYTPSNAACETSTCIWCLVSAACRMHRTVDCIFRAYCGRTKALLPENEQSVIVNEVADCRYNAPPEPCTKFHSVQVSAD